MIAGVVGCGEGPADLTRVDDLRLVAAIAEPPEVAVGASYTLTAVIADPFGDGADVVIWQCGPPELPCQVVETPLGGVDGDTASTEWVAGAPGPVWIVACLPGICAPPTETALRDPASWLRSLPIAGVAAGTKTVGLANGAEPRRNPVISTAPEAVFAADPEDAVPLRFVAEGVERVSGLATAGGFAQVSEAVPRTGDFTLDWLTPVEVGEARIWVVLDDGLGGSAVWRGTGDVR